MKITKLLLTASLAMAAQAAQAQNLPAPLFSTPGASDVSNRAATTAWVRGQGYLTAITPGQMSAALGFAPQRATVLNVLDYGAVADGVTDLGPALRAIAAKLGGSGVSNEILIPAGHYVLSSPVVFTAGAPVLRGQGFTAGPNPASGTWITISAPGFVPFTFSGLSARGAVVRDLAIVQTQPAPAAGWAPTNYDYVFKVLNALGEVTFDNLLFAGITRGIYADNSGRLLIRNVVGQFYVAGVEIDDCYDIPRIEALHAWTYSTSSPYVTAWQEANLDTVILRRVDGIFIGDLFSYAARSALYLTSGVNGVTTKLYLKSLYADFVKYGVWIDGSGVSGQIAQATTQHQDAAVGGGVTIPGGRGLYVTGDTAQLQIGAWRTNSVAGPVIDLESTNAHVVINDLWANAYGVTPGGGTPAVFAADSGASPGNFVQVLGTPMLQGVAPLYLYNSGVNAGRLRMPSMNSVGRAVNEPRLYDNSAGNPVTVAAVGADPSIDLQLQAKSLTGSVRLQANGQTVLRADDANGGTDDVLFRAGAGTMNLVAEGGDASIDYLLTPKGVAGGVRLQGNGLTTLRTDNPNGGDSAMLVRPGVGAVNLIAESASTSADLVVAAKGPNGGVRLQAQGATVVRLDNPGAPGTSDLLIRSGNQTVALTVEDPAANANLVLNPKGLGTVALGTSPNVTDNSTNVVTSAWVVGQHYLTAAPVASVNGRTGAVTLAYGDVPGDAPLLSPAFSGVPSVPTAAAGTSTTQAASTAFVAGAVAAASGTAGVSSVNARTGPVTLALSDIPGVAPLASPALTGTPSAPTAIVGTATAQLATTAYVLGQGFVTSAQAAAAAPVRTVAGRAGAVVVAVGDVSGAAPLASPALTGTPSAPTAAAGPGTTQLATTAYVQGQGYQTATQAAAAAPVQSVSGRTGAVTLAVADVAGAFAASSAGPLATQAGSTAALAVTGALGFTPYNATNPNGYVNAAGASAAAPVSAVAGRTGAVVVALSDVAGAAPLASPALTGTPAAPTATAGTNTTQIATTAYATAAVAGEATTARTAEGSKAPLASPQFTGTPNLPPFTTGSTIGAKVALYGALNGAGTYGIGLNSAEVTLYTGGSVGLRDSTTAGVNGPLFLTANPAGTTIPGLLTAAGQSTVGAAPGGSGFARAGVYVLEASTTAATPSRMTTDGNAAGPANCINLPNASAYSANVDITGIDRTTAASAARYRVLDVMLLRGASAAATVIVNGVTAAAPNGSVGSGSAASFTVAADTANGCLALSVTAPNADTWHWSARVLTTEVQ